MGNSFWLSLKVCSSKSSIVKALSDTYYLYNNALLYNTGNYCHNYCTNFNYKRHNVQWDMAQLTIATIKIKERILLLQRSNTCRLGSVCCSPSPWHCIAFHAHVLPQGMQICLYLCKSSEVGVLCCGTKISRFWIETNRCFAAKDTPPAKSHQDKGKVKGIWTACTHTASHSPIDPRLINRLIT